MSAARAMPTLQSRVREVWRRTQRLHASAGMLALLRWAIPLFLVAIAVDRLMYLPAAVRGATVAVMLGLTLYKGWRSGWRELRTFNPTHVALRIEHQHGGFESLLVTAMQLREGTAGPGTSAALREKTCRLAEEQSANLRPAATVPFRALRKPGIVALVLVVVITIVGVVDRPFLVAGLQRIFTPWVDVVYPTDTQLDLGDGDLVVKQGDEVTIAAAVSGVVPERAKLSLQTGTGRARVRDLDIIDGMCSYTIASASRDFTYRIHAGDARSHWRQVRVIPSPRIDEVSATLHFPEYLQRSPEKMSGLTLTVPENTQIEWDLTLDRPLREASLLRETGEDPTPLAVNGKHVTFSDRAKESGAFRFAWVDDEHGFRFTSPRHYLQVLPDEPPRVELTRPAGNLHAILGRSVEFAVRARDDHGIADAHIAYRVEPRPEKKEQLRTAINSGAGDQVIDWDYRDAVKNVQIGDSVTFAVEVRDRYAGPGGPHRARSDIRRITFLSREDYLAEIAKRKERLLSRVRSIYRQQRAAHDLVLKLNPGSDVYIQTLQMEAARQEMLRQQLRETGRAVEALMADLAANGVADAPEGDMLDELRIRLEAIAANHMAAAAERLREQGDPLRNGVGHDPGAVARGIDLAARELARLVMRRDIDSALEVFAREVRTIAQYCAVFRHDAVISEGTTAGTANNGHVEAQRLAAIDELAEEQEELAGWTRTLFAELEAGMQYTKRPLAVLNVTRRIKDCRQAGVEASMKETAALVRKGEVSEAMARQSVPIHALLAAEFKVRRGVEYRTLLTARDQLASIQRQQDDLVRATQALNSSPDASADILAQRQTVLRQALAGILLPSIPAPRPRLFDKPRPQAPPVEDLLWDAQHAMGAGAAKLTAGDTAAAAESQRAATEALASLVKIVRRRTEESLAETAGLSKVTATVSDWALRAAEFETRQVRLLEDTDIAAADEQPCASLAAVQQPLVEDIIRFREDIRRQNQQLDLPQSDLAPLLGRLQKVVAAMEQVLPTLRNNRHDAAIEQQEQAADLMADVAIRTQAQSERLAMLQQLLALEGAVGAASQHMADLAAEQRDLIAAIEEATPQRLFGVLPAQKNLRQCLVDIAPLLDFVAGQLDIGTPLVFSGADMEDAISALGDQDREEALDALDVASESLQDVATLIQKMSRQVGYIAEIVDFLHVACGESGYAAYQQEQLRGAIADQQDTIPGDLVNRQAALRGRVGKLDDLIGRAAGPVNELIATTPLVDAALKGLNQGHPAACREQMGKVCETLDSNAQTLFSLIEMLRGLPKLPLNSMTADDVRQLLEVLTVASNHHTLYRATQATDGKKVTKLAAEQEKLAARCRAFVDGENPAPKLVAAEKHLAKAASLLKSSQRDQALAAQEAAEAEMRHFILAQSLLLKTSLPPPVPSDPDAPASGDPNTTGSDIAKSIGMVGDFVSGEVPKNQRSEWEILRQRTRAALHENFARELPLEYRGMLKSYFERVAK